MGKALEYTADVLVVSKRGSLGFFTSANCVITGTRKLDGPAYLDAVIKSIYEQAHPGIEVTDCRCNVQGIYSSDRHHHFSCAVRLQGADKGTGQKAGLQDHLDVYVDRTTITLIEQEED